MKTGVGKPGTERLDANTGAGQFGIQRLIASGQALLLLLGAVAIAVG